jgi:sec-independent protein translocase protein TatC
MSFTGVFGIVLVAIIALALLGPRKLPAGVEQVWLMLTNLRRSQQDLEPLSLEQARAIWDSTDAALYDIVEILYAASEHLEELRKRLFVVIGALVVGAVIAAFFGDRILTLLTEPAGDVQLIVLRPTDMIWTYFEVVFSTAAVVALPVLLYESLIFIRPALESPREIKAYRAVAIIGMPMVALFFVAGLAFAYFVMLPFGLKYLQSFGSSLAEANWNIREYFSFVLRVMLWIGVAFETPVIMAMLGGLGIVSPQSMRNKWRWAVVGGAIIAAAITPTVDPVNMALVMAPLLGLYALGIIMASVVYRKRSPISETADE